MTELKRSQSGQTMVLTISNPSMRNALGPEIYASGMEALSHAKSAPDVRSIVIVGDGTDFCAGGNLHRLQGNRDLPRDVQAKSIDVLHAFIEALRTSPKPIIAAVEGAAAGAGFSLALACDFIVAARDSIFSMAYANIGLSPDGGGSWHLVRGLPRQLAAELMMFGERMGAGRMHDLGMVNRLAEPGSALADALALAQKINLRAPNALTSIKGLVRFSEQNSLHEHLIRERDQFVANLHHPNAGEGIAAFLGKRAAKYE
jgi:enoyl-CoA hydratase/carnithine racemase